VLTSIVSVLKRNALRIGVVLASFGLVSGAILVQQQREASAEQGFQSARQQMLAEQQHAQALGLQASEYADLQRQELTTSGGSAPSGTAPFNESRIDYFANAGAQERQLSQQLQTRMQQLLSEARTSAQQALTKFQGDLSSARQLGVEDQFLTDFVSLPATAQSEFDHAATLAEYRKVTADVKDPEGKLALLIADQQATNALVGQYAAQMAAQDQGNVAVAQTAAKGALAKVQGDLQTADIFKMDVSIIDARVKKLATDLGTATTAKDLEQIYGALAVRDRVLQQAMSNTLPEKALTISLKDQTLRAYVHGQQVFSTYVTTGRPGLETDPGSFHVYLKASPWIMKSPWPKGSKWWYPDTPVKMTLWFNGGAAIHDASWRAYYGPGTEYPHYDPFGANTGTHGCVNVPYSNMLWLWSWTPSGTPVVVY
jgi:lipoprotein-anchoring transpeptidase ErfK/SrfK